MLLLLKKPARAFKNTKIFMSLIDYIRETRKELTKVNWPTKKETISSTVLVIALSIGTAIFLGALDFIFQQVLRVIIS